MRQSNTTKDKMVKFKEVHLPKKILNLHLGFETKQTTKRISSTKIADKQDIKPKFIP